MKISFDLFGERWKCYLVPPYRLSKKIKGEEDAQRLDGDCMVPPEPSTVLPAKFRRIRIRNNMDDEDTMETAIHEVLHGALPWMNEAWVSALARDATRLLLKMGFCRRGNDGDQ